MKIFLAILLLELFSFCAIAQVQNQNDTEPWHSIKLLKSTRAQVEKIFGSPEKKDCISCIYKIADGKIQIDYSTIPCKSSLEGWNVPPDTVLKLKVIPKEFIEFSDLKLNEKDYEEYDPYGGEPIQTFLLNKNTGAFYEVFDKKKITSFFFEPDETDSNLRCSCYPPYNPIGRLYIYYNYINENEIKATLDGYYLQSQAYGGSSIVNVVIYIGKTETIEKYKTIKEKIKNHWKFRDYPPEALRIIYGGKREKFQINSILLPRHYPPPVPEPDNPSEYCLTATQK